jgi:hypothetical protein
MNKREACDWVHRHLIIDEMPFDDLVAVFTVLSGRRPATADRPGELFRRCWEMVVSLTGVGERREPVMTSRPRTPWVA